MDNNELNNNLQPNLGDQIMMGDTPSINPQPQNNVNMDQGINTVLQNNLNQNQSAPVQSDAVMQNNAANTIFSDIQPAAEPIQNISQDIQPTVTEPNVQPQPSMQPKMDPIGQPAMMDVPTMESEEPVIPTSSSQKKGKGPVIIIIILILIILGLAGYIVYDKFIAKEDVPTPLQPTTTIEDKSTKTTNLSEEKQKEDYYIKIDSSKEEQLLNKKLGTFKTKNKTYDVSLNKVEDPNSYLVVVNVGEIKIELKDYNGIPSIIALMNEEYILIFEEGSSQNEFLVYDLKGNKLETLGNTLGEMDSAIDIDKLIIDDKNFTYYDCKFNNGPGTETLTEYSVKFETGKYTKEETSVKQNVTCLTGA